MACTSIISQVLVVLCAILATVSSRPRDAAYISTNQGNIKRTQHFMFYPHSLNNEFLNRPENKPKGCFHFFVTRNVSSLLAEATKMLPTIRDRQEREWVLTFIYRLKSLSEHLRSHPESQNYGCLPTDDESRKHISDLREQQQPELYFEDEYSKRSGEGEILQERTEEEHDNQEISRSSEEHKENPKEAKKPTEKQEEDPEKTTKSADDQKTSDHDTSNSSGEQKKNSQKPEKSAEDHQEHVKYHDEHHDSSEEHHEKRLDSKEEASTNKISELNKESAAGYISPPIRNTADSLMSSSEYELNYNPMKRKDDSSKEQSEISNVETAENGIVLSSSADCKSVMECKNDNVPSLKDEPETDDIYRLYQRSEAQDYNNLENFEEELLKLRIRKALLEELAPELKKLKTVGGTNRDLMMLWNSIQTDKRMDDAEPDFDYEENGAAAGDLDMTEKIQPDRTAAPSLDQVQNSRQTKDPSYEPYDDSDVLVQQLFDVRFDNPPSKTTKSLSDQNNEYLMTSTHTSY